MTNMIKRALLVTALAIGTTGFAISPGNATEPGWGGWGVPANPGTPIPATPGITTFPSYGFQAQGVVNSWDAARATGMAQSLNPAGSANVLQQTTQTRDIAVTFDGSICGPVCSVVSIDATIRTQMLGFQGAQDPGKNGVAAVQTEGRSFAHQGFDARMSFPNVPGVPTTASAP